MAKKKTAKDWRSEPRKEVTRNRHIDVRVSDEEYEAITANAAAAGVKVSEYLRNLGIRKKNHSP